MDKKGGKGDLSRQPQRQKALWFENMKNNRKNKPLQARYCACTVSISAAC